MSQFIFLEAEFPELYAAAVKAEGFALSDPRTACFHARFALEGMVSWLYAHDGTLRNPYETALGARIHEPTFRTLVGDALVTKARIIKDLGNKAVHETKSVAPSAAITALRELFHLAYWLTRTYARGVKPNPGLAFAPDALPRFTRVPNATLAQLQDLAKRAEQEAKAKAEADRQRLASEELRTALEAELAQLRAEIAAVKLANTALADHHDYDEAKTRDAFIDLLLAEAGWRFTKPAHDTEFPVTGMPNASGTGFVDYVLWGDDGKPLGLVEAKRTRHDARIGQQQAKLYADCLEAQFGQRPVIFYSNGYDHWIWDDRRYPPREIQGFLAKDELELAIQRRTSLQSPGSLPIDGTIVERYYQTRAIRRVGESFEKDNLRRALLVMATGAGKTRTVIALSDLLMRANWARRILFLADRVALVNQAIKAFTKFLPAASPVNLVTDRESTGRVYVSTYPTMMGLIDVMADGKRRFGPGYFDLIVIDEAHRSVYRKYGAIFDYFDSLIVGLTATPKAEIDRNTYRLFDLQNGVPTDAYGLDEAVADGFLVPPKAVSISTDFMERGIDYAALPESEKEAWDDIEWDDDGTVPVRVESAAVNQWLFNKDTVDKVLEHLMVNGIKVADGDRLGKTIVFAKNHHHAQFIADRFNANYPHYKGTFAQVIDFQTKYVQSLIDGFSQLDKEPHIAVSVDMLDTGIDVPEVVNLVFFKVVRSKTKFWQMIGRGTRLRPDLFGPGLPKRDFAIFDWCRNFEFFNENPDVADGSAGDSLGKRLFVSRLDLVGELDGILAAGQEPAQPGDYKVSPPLVLNLGEPGSKPDLDAQHGSLRETLTQRLRDEVGAMSLDNFIVRPRRRLVEKYADPASWRALGPNERTELADEVAGLPSSLVDDDIAAKQFDLLVLRTQLAILRAEKSFDGLRRNIVQIAGLLEELANVPMVAKELALIHRLQSDAFWQDITLPMLESVRRQLRELVKLIELKKRPIVYTDFEDAIVGGAETAVTGITVGTDMDRFRQKARHFLKANENHIAVLKLRRNEPLTPMDLDTLEQILIAAGVAQPADLDQVRAEGGLGLFVRSLVGMEREAAKRAFEGLLATHPFSADQIEFLNIIIDHLTERGSMDPRLLYESPFTDLDPFGVAGLFSDGEVVELVGILDEVRSRAAA